MDREEIGLTHERLEQELAEKNALIDRAIDLMSLFEDGQFEVLLKDMRIARGVK